MSRLLAILPAALLALILLRPVHDVDIFWQLALGERGGWVDREPFLASKLGEPMIPAYWLGQVILAKIRLIGGWRLLTLFDAAMWIGGFLFAAKCVTECGVKARSLALIGGFLTAVAFQSIRPQSFAVLLFGSLMFLLNRRLPVWMTLAIGAPLLIFWQNLHPSVIVAFVFLVCRMSAELFGWWRGRGAWPHREMTLMLVSVAAMFATPAGWSILSLSAANAEMSTWLKIPEWMPLFSAENRRHDAFGAWLGLASLAAAILFRRQQLTLSHLVPAMIFAILTLTAYRFALFFGLTLIPVLIEAMKIDTDERTDDRRTSIATFLLVLVAFLFVPPRFDPTFPMATLEEMNRLAIRGTVYTHRAWGSLIPDRVPSCHATHDGRMYLRSREEWDRYQRVAGEADSLNDVIRSEDPNAFLLRPGFEDPLIDQLKNHPDWVCFQLEANAILFVPRQP